MSLRMVQAGEGTRRDVVVIYHLAAELDDAIRQACGPGACILNETGPAFRKFYTAIGANQLTPLSDLQPPVPMAPPPWGLFEIQNLILVGFSEGCQAPRTQLLAGVFPSAILAIDGIHASSPPAPSQITTWQEYLTAARELHAVFEHTFTAIKTTGYLSTSATAALIWQVDTQKTDALPWMSGALTNPQGEVKGRALIEGWAGLYAFPGDDAAAHVEQARKVLPELLRRTLRALDYKRVAWKIPKPAPAPGGGTTTPPGGGATPPGGTPPGQGQQPQGGGMAPGGRPPQGQNPNGTIAPQQPAAQQSESGPGAGVFVIVALAALALALALGKKR